MSDQIARSPVLTLTGPPGVGKTRIALELMDRLAPDLGRSYFIDLSAVVDPARVVEAVAARFGVREETARPLLDTLAHYVGAEALVWVFDNCEHVVEGAAEVVDQLVRRCPGLRVVATSQERLRIDGERVWEVSPLSLPSSASSDPDEVSESEAVQLFCERAKAVRPGFAVTETNTPAVSEICRNLDGIPLAIELAAALMGVSSPEVVADALDARFSLLRSGTRSAPPRHQTLLDALEWSYGLLAPPERALLRRLSLFAGGATAQAVWEVCADKGQARGEVLGLLTRLVERSLVVVDPTAADPRYRLLESISHFAADKLAEAGETSSLRERHLGWCMTLGLAAAQAGGPLPEWLIAEEHNLSSALQWAAGEGRTEAALRLAGAHMLLCRRAGRYREGREWAERVLSLPEAPGDEVPRVHRLLDAASLAAVAGDLEAALASAEEALARLGQDAPPADQADALILVGFLSLLVRVPESALKTLERGVDLARASGDAATLAEALMASGRSRILVGDAYRAQAHFGEALAVAAGAGAPVAEADAHIGLGWASLILGDYETARSHLVEGSAAADSLGANHLRALGAVWAGELARLSGDHEQARAQYGLALEVGRAIETPYPSVRALVGLGWVAYTDGDLDNAEERWDEALLVARGVANGYLIASALEALGALALARGDAAEARSRLQEALMVARERHDKVTEAAVHDDLGRLARSEGNLVTATSAHHQALALRAGVGRRAGIVDSLEDLGGLAIAGGRASHGVRLLSVGQALRDRYGYPRPPQDAAAYEADVAAARGALSAEDFDRAWDDGARLSLEAAVAQATKGRGRRARPAKGWDALTPAERQVAELVAAGLTNPEVARRLFISPRTVDAHLRSIFAKLGVSSRGALSREVPRP